MRTHRTAAGIAAAVDAAGMLMSPEMAAAHAAEVDQWKATAESWRRRAYAAENVRWDDELPPGGEVCATCEQPVESEPCPEHNPRALIAPLRADRDQFADRVDTLTKVAKGNKRHVQALTGELEDAQARIDELEKQLATARADGYQHAIDVMRAERLPMSVGLLEAQRDLDALDAAEGGERS
jgi:hypothetical protein